MSETSKDYLSKYSGEQVEARLGRCNLVPTLDHVPGAEDLSFVDAEGTHTFLVGDECRYLDTKKKAYRFYKLNDITSDGKAVWLLVGGVEAGDELSKEAIEQALTGNITTHRHDTTYNYTDFETDVWDGTSISTSLQGSGTKEDPYLIQSCSDWLHLRLNPGQYNIYGQSDLGNATEFKPYFKLNKNLDFGNKTIPELDISSVEQSLMCVFDGSGAKLSNFVDSQGTGILPVCSYYFAHDFVIDNLQITLDVSVDAIPVFSVIDLYSTIINCTVNADITITGTLSESKELPIVLSGEYASFMENNFATEVNEYIENNGCLSGIDINITDNTVKSNGAKLAANIAFSYLVHPIVCYITTPLTGVDYSSGSPEIVSDFSISSILVGVSPSCLYTNSEGDNKMYVHGLEGENTIFTGTPKSLAEMKSASFVEELNSHLPKPAFRQDPDGGTPILAGGNATIAYDGYVKKSEFEEFKKSLKEEQEKPEEPVVSESPFYKFNHTGINRNSTKGVIQSTDTSLGFTLLDEEGVKDVEGCLEAISKGKRILFNIPDTNSVGDHYYEGHLVNVKEEESSYLYGFSIGDFSVISDGSLNTTGIDANVYNISISKSGDNYSIMSAGYIKGL